MSRAIFLSAGIGDFLAIEPYIPHRDTITQVFLATRAWSEIGEIIRAMPFWRRARDIEVIHRDWTLGPVYRAAQIPELPPGVEDWSIMPVFERIERGELQYQEPGYSPTLSHTSHSSPVVIHPCTTADVRNPRSLDSAEWAGILGYLDEHDLTATVIGGRNDHIPCDHNRLRNVCGLTPLVESIELVKRAEVFIGVDSWASVVAAKDCSKSLYVKGNNPHLQMYSSVYYAPRTDFPFLRSGLPITLRS